MMTTMTTTTTTTMSNKRQTHNTRWWRRFEEKNIVESFLVALRARAIYACNVMYLLRSSFAAVITKNDHSRFCCCCCCSWFLCFIRVRALVYVYNTWPATYATHNHLVTPCYDECVACWQRRRRVDDLNGLQLLRPQIWWLRYNFFLLLFAVNRCYNQRRPCRTNDQSLIPDDDAAATWFIWLFGVAQKIQKNRAQNILRWHWAIAVRPVKIVHEGHCASLSLSL